jgi:hypothetical protein
MCVGSCASGGLAPAVRDVGDRGAFRDPKEGASAWEKKAPLWDEGAVDCLYVRNWRAAPTSRGRLRSAGARPVLAMASGDALTGNPGQRHRQSASLTKGRGGMSNGV